MKINIEKEFAPLRNTITKHIMRMWFTIDYLCDPFLEPAEDATDGLEEPPDWWTHDVQEFGIDWSMNLDTPEKFLLFLLKKGIAPGQPFLIEFTEPHHWKSWTDYGYEYDVDYNWKLVQIHPMGPADVLRRWEQGLEELLA